MTSVNKMDYSLDYMLFCFNEAYEQEKFNKNLSAVLNESVEVVLNESIGETLKGWLDKIYSAIINVWEKFLKAVNDFTTNNNKYLEKYKDIILNKKPLKATISGYTEYDTGAIKTADVPSFDEVKMKAAAASGDKQDFIKAFPEFSKFNIDKEKSFSDNVKYCLKNKKEPHDIQANTLNMEILYNYTHNYNTEIKKDIMDSIDKLKASNKKAYLIVAKLGKGAKANVKIDKKTNTTTSTDNTETKTDTTQTASTDNNATEKQEAFNYNKTLSYYFEMDIKDDPNQEQPEKEEAPKEPTNDEDKKAENAVKLYFTVCSELLGARLNVAQEAYKNYMRIIKWHVKKYVKNPEAGTTEEKPNEEKKTEEQPKETNKEEKK